MQEILSFFKYLATSNTINFIIMIIILAVIVKKMNLSASMDKSISGVESSIKKSDDEKSNAEKMLNDATLKVEELPKDIKKLEQEADLKADVFKSKIEESTQKTIFEIDKSVDRAISIEEKKMSNILTGKTIIASVELAKDQIKNLLKVNPDLHNKFFEDSLDELGRVKL